MVEYSCIVHIGSLRAESLEIGRHELFVKPQFDMEVAHEKFEDRVGMESGFESEVLYKGGGLDGLSIFDVAKCGLVDKEVFVVEGEDGVGLFGICCIKSNIL